jgi:hypothetical protein
MIKVNTIFYENPDKVSYIHTTTIMMEDLKAKIGEDVI